VEGVEDPRCWGQADAGARAARGAVERRAHGGAEEMLRRSSAERGPRVWERHQA
jgi:hypothetical protein